MTQVDIRQAYKDVFENGTVRTKNGLSCSARHALNVIQAINGLIPTKPDQLRELLDAGEATRISDITKEALGSHVTILTSVGGVGPTTSQILLDVVKAPTLISNISWWMDASHYTEQFEAQARTKGAQLDWREGYRPLLSKPKVLP